MRTQTTTISSLSPEYQELKKLFPSLGKKPPAPDPLPSQPVDGPALLHDISGFIGRYLQCSDHQRTLLALWVFHTWCSAAAQVTPYLSIHSAYKQSGKTLCLQLLSLLCDNPTLTAGFTTSKLALRMRLKPPSALLLDDCHAILGTGSRSKRPGLQAILAGGYHRGLGYSGAVEEYNLFCPKAFAGTGQLPEALADRSLPIILQPLKRTIAPFMKTAGMSNNPEAIDNVEMVFRSPDHQITGDYPTIQRFHLRQAQQEAEPLRERLSHWAEHHLPRLEELPPYSEPDFPPNLSPRRQDLCEPLLQLAGTIGGQWPARAREAITSVFEQEAAFHLHSSLQLLTDIHHCFFYHGFPERLSTSTLLDWMHILPARPWDIDGPLTARSFARLLAVFDVRPRLQRVGEEGPARGYQLHDFLEPWRREFAFAPPLGSAPTGKPAENRPLAANPSEMETPNKDAVCNAFAEDRTVKRTKEELMAEYRAVLAELASRNQRLEPSPSRISGPKSEIANNACPRGELASRRDAGCNAIAQAGVLSHSSETRC